jgi:CTP synthase (UTP-ammonia lyase)
MVPHVSDAIIDWISEVSMIPVEEGNPKPQICLVELGGEQIYAV